jgi:hypothetical protein
MKRMLAGAACLALLALVITPLASDAAKKKAAPKPRLSLATYDGPDIKVAPLGVTDVDQYVIRCPHGWQTTGFGVLNGATDLVFADPTNDGRGYSFVFGNPSSSSSFTASASVRCAKGGKRLKVAPASAHRHNSARRMRAEWLAAHG